MSKPTTAADIARMIESELARKTGAVMIVWTFRTEDHYTLSGHPDEVAKALPEALAAGLEIEGEETYEDEDGVERYVFLTRTS